MADLIERRMAYIFLTEYYNHRTENQHKALKEALSRVPEAHPEKCSDILDELKADDYYNYIHTGHSRFSEDDWDYLIRNAKEKEKLHERLCQQADSDQCS